MAKRYFNWKLALVILIGTVVLAATALALRRWQKSSRADRGLQLGVEAYEEHRWEEAATQLGRFVAVNRDRVDVLLLYAKAQLNVRPLSRDGVGLAVSALRSILRRDEGHTEATRELAETYLMMGSPGEAELITERCLRQLDVNDLDVERLLVHAMIRQRKFDESKSRLTSVIDAHPDRIWPYELLAYVEHLANQASATRLWTHRDTASAEAVKWLDRAVATNRNGAMAYIARAGYYLVYPDPQNPSAASEDLNRAEQANPSDPEVCLRLVRTLIDAEEFDRARRHLESLEGQLGADVDFWLPPQYTVGSRAGRPRVDARHAYWTQRAELVAAAGGVEDKAAVAEQGLAALSAQPWDFMPVAADLLIQSGRTEAAQELLSAMREKNINSADIVSLEGDLAAEEGRLRDAVSSWQKAASLLSGQDQQQRRKQSRIRVKLADALARLGDLPSAMGQLRLALSQDPTYHWPRYALARLLVRAGDWAGVLEETQRLRRLIDYPPAELLEVQARINLMPEASSAEQMAELTKPALARRLTLVEKCGAKDTQTAKLNQIRAALSGDDPAAAAAALAEVERRFWQSIDNDLRALEEKLEGPNQVLLLQAQAALRRREHGKVTRLLEEVERRRPGVTKVTLLRAALHDAKGEKSQAVGLLQEAMNEHPEDVDLVRKLTALLTQYGQYDECEAVLKDAYDRFERPAVRRTLGLLLAELYGRTGEEDEACQWLTSLADEFPSDVQTRRMLLACAPVAGDPDAAQEVIDQIRQIEGDAGWQWRCEQAKLWLRSDSFAADHYEQTVRLLQENLLANPEDGYSRRLLGDAHVAAGQPQLAIAAYREALSRNPDNAALTIRLASAYHAAGQTDQVMDVVEGAIRRGVDSPQLRRFQLNYHMMGEDWELASALSGQLAARDPNDVAAIRAQVFSLVQQQKFDEAQKVLAEALAAKPDSHLLLIAQWWLHMQRGNPEEALRFCDQVVENRQDLFSFLLRAQAYVDLGQFDEALADYDRALEQDQRNAQLWKLRGDFLRRRGRIAEAVGDYRQALELASGDRAIQYAACDLFLATGDATLVREAGTVIDQALAVDPNDPQMRVFKAWTLIFEGTVSAEETARAMLLEAADERPDLARAWELLGKLASRNREPGKAVDFALRGLAHSPGSRALTMIKAAAEAQSDPRLAVPTLEGWIAQNPNDAGAVVRLATYLTEGGEAGRAVELLQKRRASTEDPAVARTYAMALAPALYQRARQGDKANAQVLLEELMQQAPQDARPLLVLTELLSADKDWPQVKQVVQAWFERHLDDPRLVSQIANTLWPTRDVQGRRTAEDLLRMVKKRHPDHVPTLMVLSVLLQEDKRSDEAMALNRRILELDPNNPIAMNNLAWALSETEASRSAREEALQLAQRGLAIDPNYTDLIDTRGQIYYRLGQHEKAVEDFQRCVGQFRAGSRAAITCRVNLARANHELGRKTQAREQLRRAAAEAAEGLKRLESDVRFEQYPDRRAYAIDAMEEALNREDEIWRQYPDMVADVNALLAQRQKGG